MAMHRVARWVWVVIGALVGLAVDQVVRLPHANWRDAYGQTIDQREFERSLTRQIGGAQGFRDITAYPERIPDSGGATRDAYVLVGDYADHLEYRDGKPQPAWQRRSFVAQTPYKPLSAVGNYVAGTGSVLNYLDAVGASAKPIGYRVAWWRGSGRATAFWVAAGVIVIGGVWPTLINVIVYGRLVRPAEPKGIDLSKVTATPAAPDAGVSQADLDKAVELAARIEAELRDGNDGRPLEAATATATTASAKPLSSAAAETPLAPVDEQGKDFGRDPGDFYPTERHAHHPPRDDHG